MVGQLALHVTLSVLAAGPINNPDPRCESSSAGAHTRPR
jgi:hypothetical protein